MIRRVQRLVEGGTRVGVEVLGSLPLPVTLSEADNDASSSGLYITQTNAKKGQRVFLIPKRLADKGKELTFAANGKSYQIRVLQTTAAFEDCQQVEFETLERL